MKPPKKGKRNINLRLIVSIMLAIAIIGSGALEEVYLNKVFSEYTDMLEDLMADAEEGTFDLEKILSIQEWWDKKHETLEIFLPHLPLNEVKMCYGEFLGAVKAGDDKTATSLLERLISTSEALEEMFTVDISNIL
jgi:hypothetical protein